LVIINVLLYINNKMENIIKISSKLERSQSETIIK